MQPTWSEKLASALTHSLAHDVAQREWIEVEETLFEALKISAQAFNQNTPNALQVHIMRSPASITALLARAQVQLSRMGPVPQWLQDEQIFALDVIAVNQFQTSSVRVALLKPGFDVLGDTAWRIQPTSGAETLEAPALTSEARIGGSGHSFTARLQALSGEHTTEQVCKLVFELLISCIK